MSESVVGQTKLNSDQIVLGTKQWEGIKSVVFSTEATDDELSVYREYFFHGDVEKYLDEGGFKDFLNVLTWNPSKSLLDLIEVTEIYWEWFFQFEGRDDLIASYNCTSYEEYLNFVVEGLTSWTPSWDAEVAANYILWVYGEKYEEGRRFPIALNRGRWIPKLLFNETKVAFNLLRGISCFIQESSPDNNFSKYVFLVDYFSSISDFIYPNLFDLYKLTGLNSFGFSYLDQRVIRRLLAHMEGLATTDDANFSDGKAIHYHPELVEKVKWILLQGSLSKEYKVLIDFMAGNGRRCIKVFKD